MYGDGPDGHMNSHHMLRQLANVAVVNSYRSIEQLWEYLDETNLTNVDRLRPQWDTYFMASASLLRPISGLLEVETLASLASQRSNCMKRRVGAILVRSSYILPSITSRLER